MRSIFILILLAVLPVLSPTVLAGAEQKTAPKAKTAEPAGNRYLFVMENSSSMRKRDEKLRQAVFDTIYGGVYGRMTPGDTFGVWLYSTETDTRFPMQIWDPSKRLDIGSRVNLFMRERGYRKHSNLSAVMRDLSAVLQAVGDVTVVVFNEGEDKMVGTPFDREINGFYKELGPALAAEKEPFITALVAEHGQFVAYAVARPGEQLTLPPVTVNPSRKSGTNQTPNIELALTAPKPAVNNRPARQVPQIVITRESNAADQLAAAQARTTSGAGSELASEPFPVPPLASASQATNQPPKTPTSSAANPEPLLAQAPSTPSISTSAPAVRVISTLAASVTARVFPPGSTSPPNPVVSATPPAPTTSPAVQSERAGPTSGPPGNLLALASATPPTNAPSTTTLPLTVEAPSATRSAPSLVSSILPPATPVQARSPGSSNRPTAVLTGVALPNSSSRSKTKLYGALALLLGAAGWGVATLIRSRERDRGSYISRALPRTQAGPNRRPR